MTRKLPRVDPARTINYRQEGINQSRKLTFWQRLRELLGSR